MKPSTNLIFLTILILLNFQAKAWVNPADGSLRIDIELIPNTLKANYSSRRTSKGVFGIGWCTELDINVIYFDDHQIILDKCSHREVFLKENFSSNLYKNKTRTQSIRFERGQFFYIQKNPYRSLLINKKYFAKSTKERLESYLLRNSYTKTSIQIDETTSGEITAIKAGSHFIKINYLNGSLLSIKTRSNRVQFSWDSQNNVKKVFQNNKLLLSLIYDSDDRISTLKSSSCQLSYSYSFPKYLTTKTRLIKKCHKMPPQLIEFLVHYKSTQSKGRLGIKSMEIKRHQFANQNQTHQITQFHFNHHLDKIVSQPKRKEILKNRRVSNES